MAVTSNTALRITELDFDGIKNNLKNFLRSQSEFQDYDFEGSGMSVLLDILAYNTHYMGYYLNMVGNEMFMDTAQLRSSILSHAKNINYVPSSRKSAKAIVDIQVTPSNTEDNMRSSLTLFKYSKFFGTDIDGVNYNFVVLNSKNTLKLDSTFNFSNVEIKQGEVVTRQYLMDPTNTKRRFNIPSANVDTDTIEVRVQESTTNTDTKVYYKSTDITGLNSNSAVYFVEEGDDLTYNMYFGDGIIGKRPKNGNIISVTYLDTVGIPANNITKFGAKDSIGGFYRDNVAVTTITTSHGASEKEGIEDIRFRAPYSYTAQNRAVIKSDYEALMIKDFPYIDYVTVWGGEDNDPVVYGKVFLSIKTKDNFFLSNYEKESIKKHLITNRNVVTVTPEIIDPEYVYIRIEAKVNYNSKITNKTTGELSQLVKAAINDYNNFELSKFSSVFRKSKLQAYIEAADTSITGSDIIVYVQKRIVLAVSEAKQYIIPFNMSIRKGSYTNRIYSFPELLIYDYNQVERNTLFEEVLDSVSGINSFTITNGGSGYDIAPNVTIVGDGAGATAKARIANGKVVGIQILNKGSDYTVASVTFSGGNGTGAAALPRLENNYGTIRSFYYKNTGEKITIDPNAGTINYPTGLLTINSVYTSGAIDNNFYPSDIVTFFAPSESEIIQPVRNRILLIDSADPKSTQIQMVVES